MTRATIFVASAAVGSLMVVSAPALTSAQTSARQPVPPASRIASFAAGGLTGVVQDERGLPVPNVVVSALGATTLVAVTDKDGRYEFGTLSPGPYLVRAHLSGFISPRARTVQVTPSARSTTNIALRRVTAPTILTAGVGAVDLPIVEPAPASDPADEAPPADDHSETSWRLRHARRSVLKDVSLPTEFLADGDRPPSGLGGTPLELVGRAVGSPARAASSFLTDTPFTGQVNLLTTGSFDNPQELFSTAGMSRQIAFARVTAPFGDAGDWTVNGAFTQADISSWIVAGSYNTRASARHRYDVGMSYSTQRYDGGNLLALSDLAEGSRNAGSVYGYDSFAVSSAVTLTLGGAYARYDYLDDRNLVSPRAEITVSPGNDFRLSAAVARRELAPGAEEFLPPPDEGFWIPPQRTFSSLNHDRRFNAEDSLHAEGAMERDFGSTTLAVRAFREHVNDQLVTLFGADLPGQPASKLGHYLVGNLGDADAAGCSLGLRTVIARRVHGAFEYTIAQARIVPEGDRNLLVMLAPSTVRLTSERIHNFQTTVETDVPETATRVVVIYRLSNGFAGAGSDERGLKPGRDARFDVQVRQSLPFMNFSAARFEMLLAVRNFFREAGTDQSIYDELLVVHPPKRVVGGVALRF